MNVRNEVRKMKEDSPKMAALSLETRNQALKAAALALQEHKEEIFRQTKKTWKLRKQRKFYPL